MNEGMIRAIMFLSVAMVALVVVVVIVPTVEQILAEPATGPSRTAAALVKTNDGGNPYCLRTDLYMKAVWVKPPGALGLV